MEKGEKTLNEKEEAKKTGNPSEIGSQDRKKGEQYREIKIRQSQSCTKRIQSEEYRDANSETDRM